MGANALEYGRRAGGDAFQFAYPVGASEVFKKAGGGFVRTDGSGRIEMGSATDTELVGWALLNEDFTASSTEGATVLPVDLAIDHVFEIKIDTGTWANTMRLKSADLKVTSNVQGVNLSAAAVKVLQLIDRAAENTAGTVLSAFVRRFQNNLTLRTVV